MLTEKQKEDRKLGIGGSDVAAILGMSPWSGPWDVYASKKGIAQEKQESEAMSWGNRLEPVILDAYEEQEKVKVIRSPDTIVHPEYSFMRANLDALTENLVVEAKTVGIYSVDDWGKPGTDQIPLYYLPQVTHYMACTNSDEAHFAVLFAGQRFEIYRCYRDLDFEKTIIDFLATWWDYYVVSNHEPNFEDSEAQIDSNRKAIRKSDDWILQGDDRIGKAAKMLREALEEEKAAKQKKDLAKKVICDTIKDNDGIEGPGYYITYKTDKRGRRTLRTKWR